MIEEKSLNVEKTVLVGIINSRQDVIQSKEYLDELAFLAFTAGGEVMNRFTLGPVVNQYRKILLD